MKIRCSECTSLFDLADGVIEPDTLILDSNGQAHDVISCPSCGQMFGHSIVVNPSESPENRNETNQ